MRRLLLSFALALQLIGCGGGGSSPSPIPEAQASTPATGCPTGDATAQLQAMIDTAQGSLPLPACTFLTSAPLVATKPITLTGAGMRATVIRSSADEALVIAPDAAISQGYGVHIADLRIESAVGGQGKSALVFRLKPGTFVSEFSIERVYMGDFGGPGLLLDNSVGNTDGFFLGTVWRCRIVNGVKLIKVGDSITFEENTVTDGLSRRASKSGARVGLEITTVPGSRKVVMLRNSISTSGGSLVADGADGLVLDGNWFEHQSAYGVPFTSEAAGLVQISNSRAVILRGNTFNPQASGARFSLALNNTSLSVIDSNEFSGPAVEGDIAFLGTSARNRLMGVNVFQGETTGKITGAGTGLMQGSN